MFGDICIRRMQRTGTPIDLGFLAEAMVFYRKVHVVADSALLSYLFRVCGPDSLIAAVEHGFLRLSYLENNLAVSTVNQGRPTERYGLHFVSSEKQTLPSFVERQILCLSGKAGKSRRLANRMARYVDPVVWTQPEATAAMDDLLDSEITDIAAKIVLQEIAPGLRLPEDGRFRVSEGPEGLHVETDLDLAAAEPYYKRVDPDSPFGVATILIAIFEALADLRFSAGFSSELAVSANTAAIAEIKLGRLLRLRQDNDDRVKLFQEWTFHEGRAIRDAVNKGHQNFEDVLKLVQSAQRFKDWLAKQPDDADVRQEYLREVSKVDWADALPAKTFRWLLFTALGSALGFYTTPIQGVLAGAALNAVDDFMIDKLVKGWKPDQFVEGPLKGFVDPWARKLDLGTRL